MNIIVAIEGREAIPVRAIPFLTNRTVMTPDEVADALAWEGTRWRHYQMQSYRIEDDKVSPIPNAWWQNSACKDLQALADRIRANETTHSTGHREWRSESLNALPAGSFVWRDEYEEIYYRAFGIDGTIFTSDAGEVMSEDEQARHVALDFDPYIPDVEIRHVVMAGFGSPVSSSQPRPTSSNPPAENETTAQRQDRRLQACEAAGLVMPKGSGGRLPYGVGQLATAEGITRQTFSADLKAALQRRESAKSEGAPMHRA